MTTIDEIGTAMVINEHIVQDALHFKEGYKDLNRRLTDAERSKVFLNMKEK